LVHTEVPEELGGKGFAGKLVKFALDHAKRNNLRVVAHCEFAQSYISRHK
jgi:predicted GNAT family acetyltransferase